MRYMRSPGAPNGSATKRLGGQARPPEVAPGQLHAGEVQLAGHADRHRPQVVVEHERARCSRSGGRSAPTSRPSAGGVVARPPGHVDRGLGRARRGCGAATPVRSSQRRAAAARQGLAAADHVAQARPPRRRRRSRPRRRGTPRASTARSAATVIALVAHDARPGRPGSRWPSGAASTSVAPSTSGQNSSHTDTSKPIGVFCSTRSPGPSAERVLHPGQPVHDRPVRHDRALRRARSTPTCRSRRRRRRGAASTRRRRGAGRAGGRPRSHAMRRGVEDDATRRRRRAMNARRPGGRSGSSGQVGRARVEHADQGHHQVDAAGQVDADDRLGPDAPLGAARRRPRAARAASSA